MSVLKLSNGLTTRVLDEGSGPVVLLLHGNPDNADEWKPLIELLRKDFRCIAPDLPGYGTRGKTFELPKSFDYTLDAQVGFVDDVLRVVGVTGKVTLVVHDIGGIMGVPWAARNTNRLHAVVYTNTVAYPKFRWFPLANLFGARSGLKRLVAEQNMGLLGMFGGAIFRKAFARQNPQLHAAQVERFVTDFALNANAKDTTLRQFRMITDRKSTRLNSSH